MTLFLQSIEAPLENLESTRFTIVCDGVGIFKIPHPLPVLVILMVFPVELSARLVPRTQTTMISVQIVYEPVSVRIRHQTEPFERIAEAIVVPSGNDQRSRDNVVSPSSRRIEVSANTMVSVQPTGVFTISPALSVSPVAVVPWLLSIR